MPNMGFAAAILACLVTTCLMGEAHAEHDSFWYSCSSKSDCDYKGCADVGWDYGCVSVHDHLLMLQYGLLV